MKLTRKQWFAIELLACGLKQDELAHAMSWTLWEVQQFMSMVGRAAASASSSGSLSSPGSPAR